jgi:hypothetical protein
LHKLGKRDVAVNDDVIVAILDYETGVGFGDAHVLISSVHDYL